MRLSSRLLRQIAGCLVTLRSWLARKHAQHGHSKWKVYPQDNHNPGLPIVARRDRTQTLLLPKHHPIARRLLPATAGCPSRTGWHRGRAV